MHNRMFVCLALAACLPACAARADFRLQDAAPKGGGAVISGRADSQAPDPAALREPGATASVPSDKPQVPYAQGFGNAVPLSFAARQIVPRNVAIRFGKDVDQNVPVDWRGGRPWNLVIGAAVKPLHLHLTFSRTSVLIS